MTWQSLETKKEALNIECLIKNVRFIVELLMLESITAVLKPATESLQGKQVDLGSCMTTITLMKQQLQEMNGDYWHNFLFPKIMKFGEELNVDIAKPRQQHVILLQHLIPGFVPAAHVTDEEVAKVLLTKYQSLCPSTSPLKTLMISLKQPYQLSTTQKAFLTSGTFCCYLLLCPSPLVSLREFSPKYKGPRQPSEARWEQSDLRPLLSSQPIAPLCLHIKILLIRSAWSHADFILVIHKQFTCFV